MKKKFRNLLLAIQLAILYSITPVNLSASGATTRNEVTIKIPGVNKNGITNVADFWNKAIDIVKVCVFGVSGILTIALVGVFAYRSFNLAASSNNPVKRAEAVKGILYTLVGIGLFGGTTLITGLAFNLFK